MPPLQPPLPPRHLSGPPSVPPSCDCTLALLYRTFHQVGRQDHSLPAQPPGEICKHYELTPQRAFVPSSSFSQERQGNRSHTSANPRTKASHAAGCNAAHTHICADIQPQLLPALLCPSPSPCMAEHSNPASPDAAYPVGRPVRRKPKARCLPSQALGAGSPGIHQSGKDNPPPSH